MVIDGVAVNCVILGADDLWMGKVDNADFALQVVGRNISPSEVSLVSIDNLEPYAEGLRRLSQRRTP
jgi:hypothetical protein